MRETWDTVKKYAEKSKILFEFQILVLLSILVLSTLPKTQINNKRYQIEIKGTSKIKDILANKHKKIIQVATGILTFLCFLPRTKTLGLTTFFLFSLYFDIFALYIITFVSTNKGVLTWATNLISSDSKEQ